MTPSLFGSSDDETLVDFLARIVHPLIASSDQDIDVQYDIDEDLAVPTEPGLTELLIQSLVRASLHEMDDRGEMLWTACVTDNRVELELADTGTSIQDRFRWRPLVAAKLGATLRWDNCPQGGAAVTVQFPAVAATATRSFRRVA